MFETIKTKIKTHKTVIVRGTILIGIGGTVAMLASRRNIPGFSIPQETSDRVKELMSTAHKNEVYIGNPDGTIGLITFKDNV